MLRSPPLFISYLSGDLSDKMNQQSARILQLWVDIRLLAVALFEYLKGFSIPFELIVSFCIRLIKRVDRTNSFF